MRSRSAPGGIPNEETDCLIRWPKGSIGWYDEQKTVRALNQLCKTYGYGRVPQLAEQLEALWRDPELQVKFEDEQKEHEKWLNDARFELGEDT